MANVTLLFSISNCKPPAVFCGTMAFILPSPSGISITNSSPLSESAGYGTVTCILPFANVTGLPVLSLKLMFSYTTSPSPTLLNAGLFFTSPSSAPGAASASLPCTSSGFTSFPASSLYSISLPASGIGVTAKPSALGLPSGLTGAAVTETVISTLCLSVVPSKYFSV